MDVLSADQQKSSWKSDEADGSHGILSRCRGLVDWWLASESIKRDASSAAC